jgi:hypothetical protein
MMPVEGALASPLPKPSGANDRELTHSPYIDAAKAQFFQHPRPQLAQRDPVARFQEATPHQGDAHSRFGSASARLDPFEDAEQPLFVERQSAHLATTLSSRRWATGENIQVKQNGRRSSARSALFQ